MANKQIEIAHKVCADSFFFFNDTATTEIYTLSLHDALPIYPQRITWQPQTWWWDLLRGLRTDRKSTRLNSSHDQSSYAVFCLKKKKKCEVHVHSWIHRQTSQADSRLWTIT